jgi:SagB-type dehydrogenase family enzyme
MRTAPSAKNWQEVDVYVAMVEGLYLYDAKAHTLEPVRKADLREKTTHFLQTSRSSVETAPLQLIYVADYAKMTIATSENNQLLYSGADSAFIAQNVYLFCASEGLATGVRSLVDKAGLAKDMKLRSQQKVVFVQAVGYPEEAKN